MESPKGMMVLYGSGPDLQEAATRPRINKGRKRLGFLFIQAIPLPSGRQLAAGCLVS
jgi:hypothetical protein